MAKVHPATFSSTSSLSLSSDYMTSAREVFTIWMKSLVLSSNGCTVYDSEGKIVYRIDNYDHKCSDEVYLMDLRGKVLFTILKKKLRVFGRWEGYRCNGSKTGKEKPWFKVKKYCRIMKRVPACKVTVGSGDGQITCYRIEALTDKSSCKILDHSGGLVAEVKRKQSSGVLLGDDVLSLVVEPNIDHSLIMGLVVVYGLINRSL